MIDDSMVVRPGQQYYARMNPQLTKRCRRRQHSAAGGRLLAVVLVLASAAALADDPGKRWPSAILELPDSVSSVFIAEAGVPRMWRFDRTPTGIVPGHESYMSIGENGAGKRRAWDRKTPLGIYFIVDQLDTSRLHDKYGVKAFPLDYPNTLDRLHGHTGDGIWVHGVQREGGRRPPRDTDGCLALPNENLVEIATAFVPNRTPVVVTPSMAWRDNAERLALVQQLRRALAEWEQAQESGDLEHYLALYAAGFEYRGLSRAEWATLRRAVLARHRRIAIDLDDLVLLADPVEEGLYLARFRHAVTLDDNRTVATKRLYWQQQDNGTLKIIAEDNG